MYFLSLLAMASAAMAASMGTKDEAPFGCGAPVPAEEHINMAKMLKKRETKLNERRQVDGSNINVDTYVHVISMDRSLEGGNLHPDLVHNQMRIMNEQYAPTGISFTLRDIDWTYNAQWATLKDEMGMKRALRRGDYDALNIYYVAYFSEPGLAGFCYYPERNVAPNTDAFFRDGCTIIGATVPGAPEKYNSNNDMVTTHEVGHWMGLFHTFEGNSCWGPNDWVDDTPAQASATRGCPRTRNSCPGLPGEDPIHNYMDYAGQPCAQEFTAGQINRMKSMWSENRKNRDGSQTSSWMSWGYPANSVGFIAEPKESSVQVGNDVPSDARMPSAGGFIAEPKQSSAQVEDEIPSDARLPSAGGFIAEPKHSSPQSEDDIPSDSRLPSAGGFIAEPKQSIPQAEGEIPSDSRLPSAGGFIAEPKQGTVQVGVEPQSDARLPSAGGYIAEPKQGSNDVAALDKADAKLPSQY